MLFRSDPAGFELINPMEEDREGKLRPKQNYSIIESLNHYSYVSNNPVKYIDPTGMDDIMAFVGGEVAFGAGIQGAIGLVSDTDDPMASGINLSGGEL